MQTTQDDIILEVQDLKTFFYFNNKVNRAVNGVSFTIRRGTDALYCRGIGVREERYGKFYYAALAGFIPD